jgi:hypothetical protein
MNSVGLCSTAGICCPKTTLSCYDHTWPTSRPKSCVWHAYQQTMWKFASCLSCLSAANAKSQILSKWSLKKKLRKGRPVHLKTCRLCGTSNSRTKESNCTMNFKLWCTSDKSRVLRVSRQRAEDCFGDSIWTDTRTYHLLARSQPAFKTDLNCHSSKRLLKSRKSRKRRKRKKRLRVKRKFGSVKWSFASRH